MTVWWDLLTYVLVAAGLVLFCFAYDRWQRPYE